MLFPLSQPGALGNFFQGTVYKKEVSKVTDIFKLWLQKISGQER